MPLVEGSFLCFFILKNERSISLVEFVLLIFLPILAAIFVPILFRKLKNIHTGWFVLIVPIILFIYYSGFIQTTMNGGHAVSTLQWIPYLGISFVSYIFGLRLLF